MLNLTTFISNHKLLSFVAVGIAAIGYLGYRAVCVLAKTGFIKKIEEVALQRVIWQTDDAVIPCKGDGYFPSSQKEPVQKGPLIVQNKQSISEFIQAEYRGETVNAKKYARRLERIASYFEMPWIRPVRGDGNCFVNAALAGLMPLIERDPEKKASIIHLVSRYAEAQEAYVSPDLISTAPFYSKKFNREDDFKLVLKTLKTPALMDEGIKTFEFSASFARIIRYILYCNRNREKQGLDEEISLTSGGDISAEIVDVLNQEFGLNVKVVILQGDAAVDSDQENQVCCYQHLYQMLDLDQKSGAEDKTLDFLIIRKGAHFLSMIPESV